MAWNRKTVLEAIGVDGAINASVVERAVYTVWIGQTETEKNMKDVIVHNNKGFSVRTRKYGSQIGQYLQWAVDKAGDPKAVKWGSIIFSKRLQVEAVAIARHHADQVARVWNEMNRQVA